MRVVRDSVAGTLPHLSRVPFPQTRLLGEVAAHALPPELAPVFRGGIHGRGLNLFNAEVALLKVGRHQRQKCRCAPIAQGLGLGEQAVEPDEHGATTLNLDSCLPVLFAEFFSE